MRDEVNAEIVKKEKIEWSFFIDDTTHRRKYNPECKRCIYHCKQSFRATILHCPKYNSKRSIKTNLFNTFFV
ncbi:MAG: hypothetical protein KBT46_00585 [Ruminococcus sp.]|nr:hypothetical protein [Candidatus Copronaster equi]